MNDDLAFESSVEVVYFECDMRHGANELVNGAVALEAHPLDPVRTGAEAAYEETELLEVRFAGVGDVCGDAHVVVPPPELRSHRGRFVIEPPDEVQAVRRGLERSDGSVGHGHLGEVEMREGPAAQGCLTAGVSRERSEASRKSAAGSGPARCYDRS